MNSGLVQEARGWVAQFGHPGLPKLKSAVPTFLDLTPKRRRSTPEVLSAQPSATSPDATVVWRWRLQSVISGRMSGSPWVGATQVHWAVHRPVAQLALSAPSHASAPSRTPFPQTVGGCTVSV